MWLRRLGVPALWPSRVKVVLLAGFKYMVIFTVFQYLADANVAYLDLRRPQFSEIRCYLPNELCLGASQPAQCMLTLDSKQFVEDLALRSTCPFQPAIVRKQRCESISLPLVDILDQASLRSADHGFNPLRAWSQLFLILVVVETIAIMLHDLFLLNEPARFQAQGYDPRNDTDKIITLYDMKSETPLLWKCVMFLCPQQSDIDVRRQDDRTLCRGCQLGKKCWSVIVRPWCWFFKAVFFILASFPYTFVMFVVSPRRMSRIAVFAANIFCMICALAFVIFSLYSISYDMLYVLLWSEPEASASGTHCVCSCNYPLRRSVNIRFIVFGFSIFLNSLNLAMLTLKGLRWAHWANMISVLYPVPIGVFPVEWTRPIRKGGGPTRWREDGAPVQGEPAFDPFCLMDEQPESGRTRPGIAPVKIGCDEPSPTVALGQLRRVMTDEVDTEVGCCGFPQLARLVGADASAAMSSAMCSLKSRLRGADDDVDF